MIHLAAEIATTKIAEVNVVGTRRLLEACESVDGIRFLFASTVVTGDAGGVVLDERSPLPVQTAYGRSKQEGERLVRESQLHTIIIRPSRVYGPGGWYAEEIIKRVRQPGRFVVIGSGQNWWDVVRVEDARADRERARGGRAAARPHLARADGHWSRPVVRSGALGAKLQRASQRKALVAAGLCLSTLGVPDAVALLAGRARGRGQLARVRSR